MSGKPRKIVGQLSEVERTSIRLAHGVAMQLTEGLSGNPRQIKRFLNNLDVAPSGCSGVQS